MNIENLDYLFIFKKPMVIFDRLHKKLCLFSLNGKPKRRACVYFYNVGPIFHNKNPARKIFQQRRAER